MASGSSRNNLLAGGFLLAAIALAVASSFIIKGIDVTPRTSYRVYFPMSVGASGLQPGSAVNLGGRQVGEVASLEFYTTTEAASIGLTDLAQVGSETEVKPATEAQVETGGPDRIAGIQVDIEINRDIPLFDNAQVFLEKQLLGSGSEINIASVGNPAASGFKARGATERLEENEAIVGRVAAPAFLRDAGLGPTEQKLISETVKRVHNIATNVDEYVKNDVPIIIDEAKKFMSDATELSGNFRKTGERVEVWNGQVDEILTNARNLSERFAPFADKADARLDEARDGIADARGAITAVRETIDTNRPKVDQTMDNVLAATQGFRDEVVPGANSTLDRAEQFVTRLDGLVAESAPSMRRILANGRLAADQLKLATIEVRSQPWRLLYQPTTKEIDEQLLYDSARTYATAVSDLRAASESLEAVLAAQTSGNAGLRSPEDIARVRAELAEAFERYARSEKALLDRLVGQE